MAWYLFSVVIHIPPMDPRHRTVDNAKRASKTKGSQKKKATELTQSGWHLGGKGDIGAKQTPSSPILPVRYT